MKKWDSVYLFGREQRTFTDEVEAVIKDIVHQNTTEKVLFLKSFFNMVTPQSLLCFNYTHGHSLQFVLHIFQFGLP